jgi:hypothetical protein
MNHYSSRIIRTGVVVAVLAWAGGLAGAAELKRAEPEVVGAGHSPSLAIGPDGKLHVLAVVDDRLVYRHQTAEGWSEPEPLAPEKFYNYAEAPFDYSRDALQDCRVYVGADGKVRATLTRGLWGRAWSWYVERDTAGGWTKPLRFPEGPEAMDRSITPHLAVDAEGRVFAVSFTLKPPQNVLVRIDPSPEGPRLAAQTPLQTGMAQTQVFWHAEQGLRVVTARKGWHIARHDPETLAAMEEPVPVAAFVGEQLRSSADADGTIHLAAGHLWGMDKPGGWYQTPGRAAAGEEPVRFRQDMRHACGGVFPVSDRARPGRVWLVGWSGDKGNKYGEVMPMYDGKHWYNFANHPENRLHVTVIEDGVVVLEHALIDERTGSQGNSHRATPAVVALPEGGIAVAYTRWAAPDPAGTETTLVRLGLVR